MKLQIWTFGKNHDNYVKEGIEDFSNRIRKYVSLEWKIIYNNKIATQKSIAEMKKLEGDLILEKLQKDDYLVLLDEKGKFLSSVEFAKFLEAKPMQGIKKIIFLIGGAFGVDDKIKTRANYSLAISSFTFPHMLVRLIVVEQIYRAFTLIKNEQYHHQ